MSFGINAGGPTTSSRVAIATTGSELGVLVRPYDNSTEQHMLWTTSGPLLKDQWQQVTATIDIPNDTIKLYVDGVEQPLSGTVNFVTATSLLNSDSSSASIGAEDDGSSSFFQGKVDEVRLSTTARSTEWLAAQTESVTDNGFISFGAEQAITLVNGVLMNDVDPEDPLTAVLVDDVSNGTLAFSNDGSFTYTPDPDFEGIDTFTYRANDGSGNSNLATVTITVNPINDAPVLDDSGAMSLTGIFENQTDPAGTTVVDIIASTGGDHITDVDAAAVEGMAVTWVDDSNGSWQYSTNGGANWTDFGAGFGQRRGGSDRHRERHDPLRAGGELQWHGHIPDAGVGRERCFGPAAPRVSIPLPMAAKPPSARLSRTSRSW